MLLYGQEAAGAAPQGANMSMFILMAIIFAIFYFLLIRPQRKKQKEHQSMVEALKGGERVVTAGGIFGTVDRVLNDRVEIRVDKNTKLQVLKTSISSIIREDAQAQDQKNN